MDRLVLIRGLSKMSCTLFLGSTGWLFLGVRVGFAMRFAQSCVTAGPCLVEGAISSGGDEGPT